MSFKYTNTKYSLRWNAEKNYIESSIEGDLSDDECVELKKDAIAIASELREKNIHDIRVFLKISNISDSYILNERNKVLLAEGLKFVDRLAVCAEGEKAKSEALKIFDMTYLIFQTIALRVFEEEETALEWLLRE